VWYYYKTMQCVFFLLLFMLSAADEEITPLVVLNAVVFHVVVFVIVSKNLFFSLVSCCHLDYKYCSGRSRCSCTISVKCSSSTQQPRNVLRRGWWYLWNFVTNLVQYYWMTWWGRWITWENIEKYKTLYKKEPSWTRYLKDVLHA